MWGDGVIAACFKFTDGSKGGNFNWQYLQNHAWKLEVLPECLDPPTLQHIKDKRKVGLTF